MQKPSLAAKKSELDMTKRLFRSSTVLSSLLMIAPVSAAFDSVSVELGGGSNVSMIRAGVQWKWSQRWWQSNTTHLSGYWDTTVAQWRCYRHRDISGGRQNITAVGITPVFRLQHNSGKGLYGEAGIGVYLLSDLYHNGGRRLSTHLQFGDHIAFGYVFQNHLDLRLKVQHFSNGGFKKPNDGADFIILSASIPFSF